MTGLVPVGGWKASPMDLMGFPTFRLSLATAAVSDPIARHLRLPTTSTTHPRLHAPRRIHLFMRIIIISQPFIITIMAVSIPRKSEALFQTLSRICDHYGPNKCLFLTLTFRTHCNLYFLKKKLRKFQTLMKPHIPTMLSVFGYTDNATHIHSLVVFDGSTPLNVLTRLTKRAKSKAGFSARMDLGPIRCRVRSFRYIATNFKKTADMLSESSPKRRFGKLWVSRGIPKNLLVKGADLTLNNKQAKRFRATMTRLAIMAGTEVGNWRQLESALCVSAHVIRKIVFRLFRRTPCALHGLHQRHLLRVFPELRRITGGVKDDLDSCKER